MTTPVSASTAELLAWLTARPQTYAETMDAWRSTCPRLTVWEDALAAGFVRVSSGRSRSDASVTVTERGLEALAASSR
jgi:hypothetical protein